MSDPLPPQHEASPEPGQRVLWLAVRRALLLVVRAIEQYYGIASCQR